MKYEEAQAALKRILKEQKTVSIPKLREIVKSMNISVNIAPPMTLKKDDDGIPSRIRYNGHEYFRISQDPNKRTKKTRR